MSENQPVALKVRNLSVYYSDRLAVNNINLDILPKKITSIIGSSGCGKSTVLRCFNRMNDQVRGARVEGEILFKGVNINNKELTPYEIRSQIGMVFQKPNPFPKSIYENVIWGAKANGMKEDWDELVEKSLKEAALWDDVKDNLKDSALTLSNGQQQRLCIARTVAVRPEIILMDEPASALDPISTLKIEDLMRKLAEDYTIVVVTHNMQQAARVSDYTAFFSLDETGSHGVLIEDDKTTKIFTNPSVQLTEDYITGRFG